MKVREHNLPYQVIDFERFKSLGRGSEVILHMEGELRTIGYMCISNGDAPDN
jgi:hypothetical protein